MVDDFNRVNGGLGANWTGNSGGYSIASNQLDVGTGQDIYWGASSYGSDQEAYVTLSTIDLNATEIDLLLKSQSNGTYFDGQIDVIYEPARKRVQVWTFTVAQGWVKRGGNVPVTIANGDQLGARAKADGQVELYRNGVLLATRDVSGWPHYASGGYIGLYCIDASNAVLDDFGGGTLANP